MIQIIKNSLYDLFSDLRFDEARHLYFVNGDNFVSVSKKIEAHYEKFNEAFFLPLCAKKENTTEEALKAQWKKKNKDACDMGHDVHLYLELHKKEQGFEGANIPQKVAGVKFLMDYIYCENPRYFIVAQELRMLHRKFKYAGTTDMLLWDSHTDTLIVADWKTNADGLFKTYGFLKPPFDLLESNPYNKYQLQFSYYQLMIEQSKYEVSDRWLIYLSPEADYTIYHTTDYTKELSEQMSGVIKEPSEMAYGLIW